METLQQPVFAFDKACDKDSGRTLHRHIFLFFTAENGWLR